MLVIFNINQFRQFSRNNKLHAYVLCISNVYFVCVGCPKLFMCMPIQLMLRYMKISSAQFSSVESRQPIADVVAAEFTHIIITAAVQLVYITTAAVPLVNVITAAVQLVNVTTAAVHLVNITTAAVPLVNVTTAAVQLVNSAAQDVVLS